MQAIGLFELQGYVPALAAVDTMLKAADVKFLTWEKKLGGWLVTIIIQGEVSAVQAALDAAEHIPFGRWQRRQLLPILIRRSCGRSRLAQVSITLIS